MDKINIRVKEEIFIERSPEIVWDYTQDFSKRLEWDKFLTKAIVIQENPVKMANIEGKGRFAATLAYKIYDRPNKTTLVFTDVKSPVIDGGGGSWQYIRKDNGTQWIQMGSCTIKNRPLMKLLVPLIKSMLRYNMKSAMKLAKKIIENSR
jgi:hypothetical protein